LIYTNPIFLKRTQTLLICPENMHQSSHSHPITPRIAVRFEESPNKCNT
jgi:hypothetical protein